MQCIFRLTWVGIFEPKEITVWRNGNTLKFFIIKYSTQSHHRLQGSRHRGYHGVIRKG